MLLLDCELASTSMSCLSSFVLPFWQAHIDRVLREAEEKRDTSSIQNEINALTLTLKDVSNREKKIAAEFRKLQETNHDLQREIQCLPENADDPKALRDRNHYLDSILKPLAAEHASLKNVEQLQTTAFEKVELETNAFRAEAETLHTRIRDLKDEITAAKEKISSQEGRDAKRKAIRKELRRVQEENNFLSTNLKLLRENLKGVIRGPRSVKKKKSGSSGKGRKGSSKKSKQRRRSNNNGGLSSGAENDSDSYGSDGFHSSDDDTSARGDANSAAGVGPLSPMARKRAMSILGARLHSADNKKLSPMRGGAYSGPRMRRNRQAHSNHTPGRGGASPVNSGGDLAQEQDVDQSIQEQEQHLMRKRSSLLEAHRVYHKRVGKQLTEAASQQFELEEQLSNIRGQLASVDAVAAESDDKRLRLVARIQQIKAAMNGESIDVVSLKKIKEQDRLARQKAARQAAEEEEAKNALLEAKHKRDEKANVYERARSRINAAAYDMGGVKLDKLFSRIDVDQSGFLDRGEFYHVIRHMLRMSKADVPEEAVDGLFDHIDIADGSKEGGDGQISLQELRRFLTEDGFDDYSSTQKEWVEAERAEEREIKRLEAQRKAKAEAEASANEQEEKTSTTAASASEEVPSEPQKTEEELEAERQQAEFEAIERQREITEARRRQERAAEQARLKEEEEAQEAERLKIEAKRQAQEEEVKRKAEEEAAEAERQAQKEVAKRKAEEAAAEAELQVQEEEAKRKAEEAKMEADQEAVEQDSGHDALKSTGDEDHVSDEKGEEHRHSVDEEDANNAALEADGPASPKIDASDDYDDDFHDDYSAAEEDEADEKIAADSTDRDEGKSQDEEEDVDFDREDPRKRMQRRIKLRDGANDGGDDDESK